MPRLRGKRGKASAERFRKRKKEEKSYRGRVNAAAIGEGLAMDKMSEIQNMTPKLLTSWGFDKLFASQLFSSGFIQDGQVKFTSSDHHRVGKRQTRTNAKKHGVVFDKRDVVDKVTIKDKYLYGSTKAAKLLKQNGFKFDKNKAVWVAYGDERDFGTVFKEFPHEVTKAANPNIVWETTESPTGETVKVSYYKSYNPKRAVDLRTTVEGVNGEAVTVPGMSLTSGSDNTINETTGEKLESKPVKSGSLFAAMEPGSKVLHFGEMDNQGKIVETGERINRLIKCNLAHDAGLKFQIPLLGFRWKPFFVHNGQSFSLPAWFVEVRDFKKDNLAKVSPALTKRLPLDIG